MLYEKINFAFHTPVQIMFARIKEYPIHMHNMVLEICLILQGEVELLSSNKRLLMETGDIHIGNANELHGYKAVTDDNAALILHLDLHACEAEYADICTYLFTTRSLERDCHSIRKLNSIVKNIAVDLLSGDSQTYHPQLPDQVKTLLRLLIEDFHYHRLDQYDLQASNVFRKNEVQLNRIRRTIDYIYKNYNKKIKIDDIANLENISTHHLTYILKSGCGMGFRSILNMARVEKSADMVLEDNLSLQQIAYECGFSKYAYFNECFQKFFGMPPALYRKELKEKTIKHRSPELISLKVDFLKSLLGQETSRHVDLNVDIEALIPQRLFEKYDRININSTGYNHLIFLSRIKAMREETYLRVVRIDSDFILKHQNNWEGLIQMIRDLLSLPLELQVIVEDCLPKSKLETILRFFEANFTSSSEKLIEFEIRYPEGRTEKALARRQTVENYGMRGSIQKITPEPRLPCKVSHVPYDLLHKICTQDGLDQDLLMLCEDGPLMNGADCSETIPLMHISGLKYPVYYLYYLLKRMGNYILVNEENYLLTSNRDKSEFQLLLYRYDEKHDNDLIVNVSVHGLPGTYLLKRYQLKHSELLEKLNYPLDLNRISAEGKELINDSLGLSKSVAFVKSPGRYQFSCKLAALDMILVSFEKME